MEPLIAPPGPDLIGIPLNRLTRWGLVQHIFQSFWCRWSKEYLHTLHQRSKWTADSIPIQKDTLVLIKTENAPPLHWPMGRVVDVFPGADGKVRVVTIKTQNGVLKRPVSKLCPLPLDET
ncbi:hypothetical protein JTB14_024396 [Gonioctena quinquepunctata]|nr:hypothetical protein JTB14_024396 [Gonioctena quinquepunctata]